MQTPFCDAAVAKIHRYVAALNKKTWGVYLRDVNRRRAQLIHRLIRGF
jgi:hypothetical protein